MSRKKHQPLRTCVGCRQVETKGSLIRVVRTPEGVELDQSGRTAGRGAYLHERKSCWQNALTGPLAKALRTTITAPERERLRQFSEGLTDPAKQQG